MPHLFDGMLLGLDGTLVHRRQRPRDGASGDGIATPECWLAFPDAAPFLSCAMTLGLAVGVLANGDEDELRRQLSTTRLDLPGVRLIASSALGFAKPHPEAFRLGCARLGTLPERTMMVSADYPGDIEGARSAGLHARHLARTGVSPDASPADSLTEVSRRLLAIQRHWPTVVGLSEAEAGRNAPNATFGDIGSWAVDPDAGFQGADAAP